MTRIVTTTYRYKRPPRKRKPVALAAVVLLMCGGQTARADRTVRCIEGPNMYHDKGTEEITVHQQEGGYEASGDEVDGRQVKSIFETKDRRQAVLYALDPSVQPLDSPVLIITVDFQTPRIVTYQVPLGGSMQLPNPYYYQGCARLD
jgi:hypothetical protein